MLPARLARLSRMLPAGGGGSLFSQPGHPASSRVASATTSAAAVGGAASPVALFAASVPPLRRRLTTAPGAAAQVTAAAPKAPLLPAHPPPPSPGPSTPPSRPPAPAVDPAPSSSLPLPGGAVGGSTRAAAEAAIAAALRRLELPPAAALTAADVVVATADVVLVGVGQSSNWAGLRAAIDKGVFDAHPRIAVVRDIFDRHPGRPVLSSVLRMLADDVVGVVRPALRAAPPGRLVNEYTLTAAGAGAGGTAAAAAVAATPSSSSAGAHMAGRLLTGHDIDLSEYLHSNGFRVLAADNVAALATMITIPVQQSSNHLLMVAPTAFQRNELAAEDNFFMTPAAAESSAGAVDGGAADNAAGAAAVVGSDAADAEALRRAVLGEFASLYTLLTSRCPGGVGARVHLFTHEEGTPDAVFPNNWFSTHTNLETDAAAGACTLVFYPMRAANRRLERRPALLARLEGFRRYTHIIDLSRQETAAEPRFLEGTGSLVLDRIHRVAYAAISERTDARLAAAWGRLLGYTVVPFHAVDGGGRPIYHTNGALREKQGQGGGRFGREGLAWEDAVLCTACCRPGMTPVCSDRNLPPPLPPDGGCFLLRSLHLVLVCLLQ